MVADGVTVTGHRPRTAEARTLARTNTARRMRAQRRGGARSGARSGSRSGARSGASLHRRRRAHSASMRSRPQCVALRRALRRAIVQRKMRSGDRRRRSCCMLRWEVLRRQSWSGSQRRCLRGVHGCRPTPKSPSSQVRSHLDSLRCDIRGPHSSVCLFLFLFFSTVQTLVDSSLMRSTPSLLRLIAKPTSLRAASQNRLLETRFSACTLASPSTPTW